MAGLKTSPLRGERGREEGNFFKMVRIWGWRWRARTVIEPQLRPEDIGRESEERGALIDSD